MPWWRPRGADPHPVRVLRAGGAGAAAAHHRPGSRHLNPELDVTTILLTMYDGRTRLASQVAEEVRAHFGDVVLSTAIPRSVRVSEAPSYGQSVMTYDPGRVAPRPIWRRRGKWPTALRNWGRWADGGECLDSSASWWPGPAADPRPVRPPSCSRGPGKQKRRARVTAPPPVVLRRCGISASVGTRQPLPPAAWPIRRSSCGPPVGRPCGGTPRARDGSGCAIPAFPCAGIAQPAAGLTGVGAEAAVVGLAAAGHSAPGMAGWWICAGLGLVFGTGP